MRPVEPVRHPLWVRLTHWVGAGAFVALGVSGVAILLALPRLFWGETGANDAPAWIVLPLPVNLEQTGWGRNLHFLAAWIFVLSGALYLAAALVSGHLFRRLAPERDQLRPGHLAGELRAHLRLRPPVPASGRERYNALQKLAYLAVLLVLAPVMLLSGLTMSPGVTAAYPELFTLFGGRQSARTVHFLAATLLVAFLLVHLWQVAANRPLRLLRGMITGRTGRTTEET
ncbi:cytochrome b/b6 domain-containing protein [Methylorubrum salsuginis]|uniref:Thiosulfate reductase cytochrome b subunit n=1 Tax=Methylorubrum salsuginis TaxID=414703 RepID=A0A1I4D314_9HYPH|nr:Thiosulfate reductase cytochrome b subunit [Methylorubrum salsuginis]